MGAASGSATILTVGTATLPVSYAWSTGATSSGITNLAAGNYSVTVSDDAGCVASESFVIDEPSQVIGSIASTDPSCNGGNDGAAAISPTGGSGAGYSYAWTPAAGITTIGNNATGFSSGNYSLVVTDGNGCNSPVLNTSFQEPLSVSIDANVGNVCSGSLIQSAAIELTATGGSSPYAFFQEAGAVDLDVTALLPLTSLSSSYSEDFYAIDANGCLSTLVNVVTPLVGQSASSDVTAYCNSFIYVSPSGSGTAGTPDCPMALNNAVWSEVTATRNIIRNS